MVKFFNDQEEKCIRDGLLKSFGEEGNNTRKAFEESLKGDQDYPDDIVNVIVYGNGESETDLIDFEGRRRFS